MQQPNHIAIIPDGNRRWAKAKGYPTLVGHRKGFDRARELVRVSREMGIHTLTLWAFSTENWNRTKREVGYLMSLYEEMIGDSLKEAHQHESKIIHLGRKDRIPKSLAKKVARAEEETRNYKKHILNVALDYGGQDEIKRAVEKGGKNFEKYLDTAGQPYPEPDLIIRTSGEFRLSGFMAWQGVYSELYFAKVHFPDFDRKEFEKAIKEFGKRQRRYGGN